MLSENFINYKYKFKANKKNKFLLHSLYSDTIRKLFSWKYLLLEYL